MTSGKPTRHTRTADGATPPTADTPHAYWVRALSYDAPTVTPARWSLAGIDELALSGGGPRGAQRGERTIAIAGDDPWMSSRHATVRRSFGRWLLEDSGSKNGTFVAGQRVTRHALGDGDLVETGHTAWWFRELASARAADDASDGGGAFVTLHPPLERELAHAIAAVAARVPVLVSGETGVGKERFVAELHARSGRRGPLVAVNCAALAPALVEAELFGHRKGAFSGAIDERVGYVRAAERGTLFLDEIGDMPTAAQAALLRVLAERTVTPVGDERAIAVDVAFVCATHRDLAARAAAGGFRADLLGRIRGVTVTIPPLRARREDIGLFIARAIARVAPAATLAPDAGRLLLGAPWPLNVRDVDHAVAAAALRAGDRPIAVGDLASVPAPVAAVAELPWSADDAALRDRVVAALAEHGGNISAAARALGRDRKQLHRWIARFAIAVPHR
jgi:sigma-54 dependent transcriptional regulator, acetoin dehydrogenase operon transcriptional activator AcoR